MMLLPALPARTPSGRLGRDHGGRNIGHQPVSGDVDDDETGECRHAEEVDVAGAS